MKNKSLYKIISASVLLLFVFSTIIGATSTTDSINQNKIISNNISKPISDYTHTVIAEACTASWCPPCATAAAVMHDIYYSGEYDFYYVALVSDKNPYANARCGELGVSSIPDYVFDGGYTRWVGSGGIPYAYTTRLDQCGARAVEDIEMALDMTWNGDGEIDIELSITNNEGSTYNGHVHTYVTEIESRWNTYGGTAPYHFAMVGNYAFNENIDISAGDTSVLSTTWDGASYGFSDLEEDNVMVIATIFNRNNNYYSDQTTALSFADMPPELDIEIGSSIGGISASVTNIDTEDLPELEWSISVTGGLLHKINVTTTGVMNGLIKGETKTIKTDKLVFGLGKINVAVSVDLGVKTKSGIILGPIIILI